MIRQRLMRIIHKLIHRRNLVVRLLLTAGCVLMPVPFAKADFVVVQNIHFGEFIIQDNYKPHILTVNPDGSYTHASNFLQISPPKPGIYQVDELAPNSVISVIATQTQRLNGGNNFFTMHNFQINHSNVDGAGLAEIRLGASVATSGNGSGYTQDTYSGQIQIQIIY